MTADVDQLANILEAAMLVAGKPMQYSQLESLFEHESEKPTRDDLKLAIEQIQATYEHKGIELVEVASGFRLQARQSMAPWITNLYQEKSPRYSRALMETLVLIAYRQPITRGEIEDVRGVAVSTNIIKTLLEREWVRVLGHRDVPGRPAILGTTRQFLDYFNLKRIDELPTLSEIKDLDQIDPDLAKEVALLESQALETDTANSEEDGESEGDEQSETDIELSEVVSDSDDQAINTPDLNQQVANEDDEQSDTDLELSEDASNSDDQELGVSELSQEPITEDDQHSETDLELSEDTSDSDDQELYVSEPNQEAITEVDGHSEADLELSEDASDTDDQAIDTSDLDQQATNESEIGNGHSDSQSDESVTEIESDVDLFLGDDELEEEPSNHDTTMIESDVDDNDVDGPAIDPTREPRSMSDVGTEIGESETLH